MTTNISSNIEYKSFIRSILEDPLDNVRRLIFADWLEDHEEYGFSETIRDSIDKYQKGIEEYNDKYFVPLTLLPDVYIQGSKGLLGYIKLPINTFTRDNCLGCNGTGIERYCDAAGDMDDRVCRDCKGLPTNHTVIKYLFNKYPIAEVEVVGITPIKVGNLFTIGLDIQISSHPYIRSIINILFRNTPDNKYPTYTTEYLTKKAFSNACVDYCRSVINLPKIKWD